MLVCWSSGKCLSVSLVDYSEIMIWILAQLYMTTPRFAKIFFRLKRSTCTLQIILQLQSQVFVFMIWKILFNKFMFDIAEIFFYCYAYIFFMSSLTFAKSTEKIGFPFFSSEYDRKILHNILAR